MVHRLSKSWAPTSGAWIVMFMSQILLQPVTACLVRFSTGNKMSVLSFWSRLCFVSHFASWRFCTGFLAKWKLRTIIVAGKIGYGTVSETLASKTPLVFVRRDHFNEEPFLRKILEVPLLPWEPLKVEQCRIFLYRRFLWMLMTMLWWLSFDMRHIEKDL